MIFKSRNMFALGLTTIVAVIAMLSSSPPRKLEALAATAKLAGPADAAVRRSVPVSEPAMAALIAESHSETSVRVADQLTKEILAAFAALLSDRVDFALTKLLPALVRENTFAAARLVESITEPNLRAEAMYVLARLWGGKNAESALAWAGGLKVEYEREAALADAGTELARENPGRALHLASRSLRADETSPALENLAHQWAEKDFAAALAWTLGNSAGAQRDQLLARLAFVQASDNAPAAARLVIEEMKAGEARDEAVISVLHQWAPRDLTGASAWAGRIPESALRERALAELSSITKFRLVEAAR